MSNPLKSKFDQEQISYLEPLAQLGTLVRVPLFANTLPLGYHYAVARERVHGTREHTRACLISWGLPSLITIMEDAAQLESPAAFYCTRKYLTELRSIQDGLFADRIRYFPVTRYQPRWVFAKSNVPLRRAVAPHKDSQVPFSSEIAHTLVENNDRCEVFSDTPDQARSLEGYLCGVLSQDNVRVIDPMASDALEGPSRPHRALQLYYYSAPTSNVLLNDRRFIPLRISDDVVGFGSEADFETGIAIVPPAGNESLVDDIRHGLMKYHERLYDCCSAVQQEDWTDSFVELTWVYNRLARAQRVSDTFVSEQEFARCLSDHHNPPHSDHL